MSGFGDMISEEDWNRLVGAGGIQRFPAGRPLLRQGDPADHVLLLTSGRVLVSRVEPDGERVVLAVRRAPQLLGELGLFGGSPRTATVTAIGPCTTVCLGGDRFRGMIRSMGLEGLLMQHLTKRLRESEDLRAELSLLAAGPRVARFLHRLACAALPAGPHGIDLGIGQTDLAAAIGLSRQTIAVEISELRKMGIITTGRNQIVVLDLVRLERCAENEVS